MTSDVASEPLEGAGLATGGAGSERARRVGRYLPMAPFFIYVTVFLLLPTAFVLVGAFQTGDGGFTLDNLGAIFTGGDFLQAFGRSIQLSVVTAIIGAVLGGLLA